ncbi:MAG: EamA family transporter [Nitrosopumilus sp.]|nr:EamA family transporter [Nitrosopumilus sp.]
MISVVSFAMIGPFALIYLINSSFIEHTTQSPGGYFSFGALLILSLICTFLANILFFRLIQLTDAIFSTSVSFLIPFVALLWGFFDGELLSLFHLLALILILSGIFLIRKK